jgi:hypothetical protein
MDGCQRSGYPDFDGVQSHCDPVCPLFIKNSRHPEGYGFVQRRRRDFDRMNHALQFRDAYPA